METSNPYSTPKGDLDQAPEGYGEVKIFSASGRLGRLRYIAYNFGISMLTFLAMSALMGISALLLPEAAMIAVMILMGIAGYVFMIVVSILLTIQRCHDFNSSGWMTLLLLVPLAPLIFWFVPGTNGGNRFGAQPPPNSGGVVALAIVIPVFFLLSSIIAAIAIPAYQNYVGQAQDLRQMEMYPQE